jgi:acid stress chaperone HdeB
MKKVCVWAFLILLGPQTSHAQVKVDTSKITCQQFLLMRDSLAFSYWLNGYYQGRRDDPVVETEALKSNAKKIRAECHLGKNQHTPVTQVIESIRPR